MNSKTLTAIALVLALAALPAARATETENLNMQVLPAPGKVVIDGKFDDWDLTGGILACSDAENLRDQYSLWFHVMYDSQNLYVLARWKDPTPLNNPGVKGDHGFAGDCLQFRTVTTDAAGKERTAHWTCWKLRDGGDLMDATYGQRLNEGNIPDAKTEGAQQTFAVDADGKGYVQEIAVPWKLLTADKQPLKPGARMVMTVEPNFTAGQFGRITMKDLFKPGVQIDRVFTFQGPTCWGYATLEKTGKLKPRSIRLSDGREFAVTMEAGLPVVNWTGLIQSKELPGFKPLRFAMPFDGYVSLNLFAPDGTVARQLLTCAFFAKGEHEIKWDGLTTPYWRTPGQPVAPGEYTWKAIAHKGIGLRLRGWASNGGSAPWDSSLTSNWGGDHGVPFSCATDGEKVYLGWTGAEAGKAVVACDLQGNVQWKHTHGGMGGAEIVAVDGGIVYVNKWASLIYRLDAKTGNYSSWKGKDSPDLQVSAIWENPAGMPDRIEGMDARNGKLYITCSAAFFRRADVKDWKPLIQKIYKDDGLARTIREKLGDWQKQRLTWWFDQNPQVGIDEALGAPNYYTPDVRDNVVSVLNGLLNSTTLVPDAAKLSPDDLAQANRRFIEKAFAADMTPMKMNFLAVLDAQTGKVIKLIDVDKPRFVRAVNDTLVYVVSDRRNILAVDPAAGTVKTVIKDLPDASGVTADEQGRLYVSVQGAEQQIRIFTADGKPAGEIGRKGGRPALGALGPGRRAQSGRPGGGQGRQAVGGGSQRDAQALQRVAGPGGGGQERGRLPQGVLRPHALRRQRRRDQPARPEHHGRRGLRVADRPQDRARRLPGDFREPLCRGRPLCRRQQRQAVPGDDCRARDTGPVHPRAAGRREVRPAREHRTQPQGEEDGLLGRRERRRTAAARRTDDASGGADDDRLSGLVAQHERRSDPLRQRPAVQGRGLHEMRRAPV